MNPRPWLVGAAIPFLVSCAATVDKGSVQATSLTPASTQVEVLRIPFDASQPTYVVTVEPLGVGTGSGGGATQAPAGGARSGWGRSAGEFWEEPRRPRPEPTRPIIKA